MRIPRLALGIFLAAMVCAPRVADAVAILKQISPNPTDYVLGTDFVPFIGTPGFTFSSPSGWAMGDLSLPTGDIDGCAANDFSGFIEGDIALIERGNCFFSDKILFAEAAGAIGAIVYDDSIPFAGAAALFDPVSVPSVFASNSVGLDLIALLDQGNVFMNIHIVPEPSTLALFLVALGGLGFLVRRRLT